ncbi:protein BUNDLE SHEATH DEFECTIVE 2, chloroplastic [Magnolia sinica]|uniref:protein BUNDLE SHEATH DEFECTIVE 2, chloroplastic n=1 Tax=Magnolia sinica TaxID=86752 RepID=UPI0026589E4A|nr:protein BUNDLE SHEATH DEFECTIVE 2, chloroplastic [Magnolia sinica]
MANALYFTTINSFKTPTKPGVAIDSHAPKVQRIDIFRHQNANFQTLKPKATGNNQRTKPNSIVCADCDGNGAVLCSQCQGTGVNSVDHFNGQFKAGGICWLCRGKRDILCGNCNGAGFMGGFMSTQDD